VHYKAMRIIYGRDKSRSELDRITGRATPEEWVEW